MLTEDFNFDQLADLQIIPKVPRKKGSKPYLDIVTAFDIETTRLPEIEQSVMYIWQFQYGFDQTVTGRTWEDFFQFLEHIVERIKGVAWLVVYVHNLSYEFQFLKGLYDFQADEVFATDSRKVLKCTMFDCIEFRCSYYLTNMPLAKFLLKYNVENKKLSGLEFDYSKRRFPWSPLTAREMEYCINDVKGLVQALYKQMASDKDNLQTIPLTATGYVRRDVKQAMKGFNHTQLQEMLPDADVYRLLREAFRGGDTIANRWNADDIIENVQSVDITSSYPSSMLMCKYPMERFYREDPDDFKKLYKMKSKALLFRIAFIGLRLKDQAEGHTYLSRDKCRSIEEGTFSNGRIIRASYLETTITDIDYEIIARRYKWDRQVIIDLYSSRYKMLPAMLRSVVIQYYKVKTKLKGVEEGTDDYLFYMKNKEKLNSTYGMTVEDPAKDSIEFIDGDFVPKDEPLEKLIARHNRSAFLSYAWGVWVTAWSRKRLADGIDVVTHNGKEPMNFIYSDTDSIKYTGDVDFTAYNRQMEEQATRWKAYAADRDGVVHFMGVYESEHYDLPNRFKTLGAKKYVLEDKDKRLHITIAGVNKKEGGKELEKIENFKEGFVFRKAGGTESVFNDHVDMVIQEDGHDLHITDNVVIRDSSYTLGITAEYRAILDGVMEIKYSDHDIDGLFKVKN